MTNFEELLRRLNEEMETEDRTRYVRFSPRGPRTDYEVVERTKFRQGFPATTIEYRAQPALACGHHLSEERQFAGYCQGKRLVSSEVCGREYCTSCALHCPECGRWISLHCCGVAYRDRFVCRSCRRRLRTTNTFSAAWNGFLQPFREEDE